MVRTREQERFARTEDVGWFGAPNYDRIVHEGREKKRDKEPPAPSPQRAAWCEIYQLASQGEVEELKRRRRAHALVLENNAGLWGETPLHYAAIESDAVTVRSLLAAGANVNATDKFAQHVLASLVSGAEAANATARREIIALLLDHDADPWVRINYSNMCCYHYAFRPEHADRAGRIALRELFARFSPPEGHEDCLEQYPSDAAM